MTILRLAGHILPTLARQAVRLFRRLPVYPYPAHGRGFHWSPVPAVRPWTTIAYRGLPLAIRSTLGTLQRSAVQPGCPWAGAELARLPLLRMRSATLSTTLGSLHRSAKLGRGL